MSIEKFTAGYVENSTANNKRWIDEIDINMLATIPYIFFSWNVILHGVFKKHLHVQTPTVMKNSCIYLVMELKSLCRVRV